MNPCHETKVATASPSHRPDDPLGSLLSSDGPALSAYWRKNTSAFEAMELANVLRAMRKVAGHLGRNVGGIHYTGMSHGGRGAILLEPALVTGRYPVPPEKVDYLVGLVTHEALHRVEWSDRVWRLLEPTFETMSGISLVQFQKIVDVGEDIYVDSVADRSIFGLYTAKARRKALQEAGSKLFSPPLSIDVLVHLWWAAAWNEKTHLVRAPEYETPLFVLERLTRELREVAKGEKRVTDRCSQRAQLYLEAWRQLKERIQIWKTIDRVLKWYPSFVKSKATEAKRGRDEPSSQRKPLAPHVMHQIELTLAQNSTDLTPIVQSVVGYDQEEVAPTSRWDFSIPSHPVVDPRTVGRLKAIFLNYGARKTLVSRGLLSGRIDRRRLYRAPVSGRCFRQVDRIPESNWNVTLLMDASGSMRGPKWRMVETTVANLQRALTGSRNHLQAYAYFEVDGVCMISRLIKDRQLLSVPPSGQTASGQAIIAVAYFMPKGRSRNLLIHVTDGESNFGCDVRYGIEYCRDRGIHLVTLGCGYKDREAMLRQYGRSLQLLDHFGQLPRAIERLLKHTFLYPGGSLAFRP